MPDSINAVAIENSTINTGIDGTTSAVTNETASSTSTSVAGIAAANSKATEATGIQDSYISSGQDQTITATEDATVTATAETVTAAPTAVEYSLISTAGVVTSSATTLNVGDAVVFNTLANGTGLTAGQIYYVIAATSGITLRFQLLLAEVQLHRRSLTRRKVQIYREHRHQPSSPAMPEPSPMQH